MLALNRSSARKYWVTQTKAIHDPSSKIDLRYYVGFSHACLLLGVIDLGEWANVQNFSAECAASQGLWMPGSTQDHPTI